MRSILGLAVAFSLLLGSEIASAAEEAKSGEDEASDTYLVAAGTTTLALRPRGGSFEGPQGDMSPTIGIGRAWTSKLAIELDAAPTFVRMHYAALAPFVEVNVLAANLVTAPAPGAGATAGMLWTF